MPLRKNNAYAVRVDIIFVDACICHCLVAGHQGESVQNGQVYGLLFCPGN